MALPEIQETIRKVGVVSMPTPPEKAKTQIESELVTFKSLMGEFGLLKK